MSGGGTRGPGLFDGGEGSSRILGRESRIWHPYTPIPAVGPRTIFTSAKGAHVFDEKGRKFFDATSSWWCITHGHCHPRLVEAIARQAATLDHVMIAPHAHPVALSLADRLLETLGAPFHRVFFSDDGSTAVECALKMAVQYWHNLGKPRKAFLSLDSAYHGDTLGAMSVSHISQFHHFFDAIRMPVHRVDLLGDVPLDAALAALAPKASDIAACVIEPLVLGAAGMRLYPVERLETLIRFCREHGILVVFDEVFTGFGRTGKMFAMDHLGDPALRPDIACLSKGLTAGMLPLAATAVSRPIYDAFSGGAERAFYHGHTFTGNPIGCAVALENLAIFDSEGTREKIAALEARLGEETPRFEALPHVSDVRQLGVIWALSLVRDKATKATFTPANGPGWRMAARAWERGQWFRPLHETVYVLPPYCASESDLQMFFEVLYSEVQAEDHYGM